jgi:hypothetical protein
MAAEAATPAEQFEPSDFWLLTLGFFTLSSHAFLSAFLTPKIPVCLSPQCIGFHFCRET